MTLKIKTETIDLEYTSDSSTVSEFEKKYILEILDKVQTKEVSTPASNNDTSSNNKTNTITSEDLAELVDTLYSRTQLINTPQFEQFSNKQLERTKKLENLAKTLAEEWYYEGFVAVSVNEKEMLSIMKDPGLYKE